MKNINKIFIMLFLSSISLIPSLAFGAVGGSNPGLCRQCQMPGNLKNWTNKAHPNCPICYASCRLVNEATASKYALCAPAPATTTPPPAAQPPIPQPEVLQAINKQPQIVQSAPIIQPAPKQQRTQENLQQPPTLSPIIPSVDTALVPLQIPSQTLEGAQKQEMTGANPLQQEPVLSPIVPADDTALAPLQIPPQSLESAQKQGVTGADPLQQKPVLSPIVPADDTALAPLQIPPQSLEGAQKQGMTGADPLQQEPELSPIVPSDDTALAPLQIPPQSLEGAQKQAMKGADRLQQEPVLSPIIPSDNTALTRIKIPGHTTKEALEKATQGIASGEKTQNSQTLSRAKAIELLKEMQNENITLSRIQELKIPKNPSAYQEELLNALENYISTMDHEISLTQAHAELERYIAVRNKIDENFEDHYGKGGTTNLDRTNALDFLKRNPTSPFEEINQYIDSLHGTLEGTASIIQQKMTDLPSGPPLQKGDQAPEITDVTKNTIEEAIRENATKEEPRVQEIEWGVLNADQKNYIEELLNKKAVDYEINRGKKIPFTLLFGFLNTKNIEDKGYFREKIGGILIITQDIFWEILGELNLQQDVLLTPDQETVFTRKEKPRDIVSPKLPTSEAKIYSEEEIQQGIIDYLNSENEKINFDDLKETVDQTYSVNYPIENLVSLLKNKGLTNKIIDIPSLETGISENSLQKWLPVELSKEVKKRGEGIGFIDLHIKGIPEFDHQENESEIDYKKKLAAYTTKKGYLTKRGVAVILRQEGIVNASALQAKGKIYDQFDLKKNLGTFSDQMLFFKIKAKYLNKGVSQKSYVIKGLKLSEDNFGKNVEDQLKLNTHEKEIKDLKIVEEKILPRFLSGQEKREIYGGPHDAQIFVSGKIRYYYDLVEMKNEDGSPVLDTNGNKIYENKKHYIVLMDTAPGKPMTDYMKKFEKGQLSPENWSLALYNAGQGIADLHISLAPEIWYNHYRDDNYDVNKLYQEFKTINHGDLHLNNIFYDDINQRINFIDTASMADSLKDPKSPFDWGDIYYLYNMFKYHHYDFSVWGYSNANWDFNRLLDGYMSRFSEAHRDSFKNLIQKKLKTLDDWYLTKIDTISGASGISRLDGLDEEIKAAQFNIITDPLYIDGRREAIKNDFKSNDLEKNVTDDIATAIIDYAIANNRRYPIRELFNALIQRGLQIENEVALATLLSDSTYLNYLVDFRKQDPTTSEISTRDINTEVVQRADEFYDSVGGTLNWADLMNNLVSQFGNDLPQGDIKNILDANGYAINDQGKAIRTFPGSSSPSSPGDFGSMGSPIPPLNSFSGMSASDSSEDNDVRHKIEEIISDPGIVQWDQLVGALDDYYAFDKNEAKIDTEIAQTLNSFGYYQDNNGGGIKRPHRQTSLGGH